MSYAADVRALPQYKHSSAYPRHAHALCRALQLAVRSPLIRAWLSAHVISDVAFVKRVLRRLCVPLRPESTVDAAGSALRLPQPPRGEFASQQLQFSNMLHGTHTRLDSALDLRRLGARCVSQSLCVLCAVHRALHLWFQCIVLRSCRAHLACPRCRAVVLGKRSVRARLDMRSFRCGVLRARRRRTGSTALRLDAHVTPHE